MQYFVLQQMFSDERKIENHCKNNPIPSCGFLARLSSFHFFNQVMRNEWLIAVASIFNFFTSQQILAAFQTQDLLSDEEFHNSRDSSIIYSYVE